MIEVRPYQGFEDITFDVSFDEVCNILKDNGVLFNTENWPNKGCTPEVAWDIIRIGKDISFFFAKGKMFKIYCENGFEGRLENGISLGMPLETAKTIDPSLQYDEWEETYVSSNGYWLEDDVETGDIISITVFIKELEDDDVFFKYEWCER